MTSRNPRPNALGQLTIDQTPLQKLKRKARLTAATWNVQGVKEPAKQAAIMRHMQQMGLDVLAVTETQASKTGMFESNKFL